MCVCLCLCVNVCLFVCASFNFTSDQNAFLSLCLSFFYHVWLKCHSDICQSVCRVKIFFFGFLFCDSRGIGKHESKIFCDKIGKNIVERFLSEMFPFLFLSIFLWATFWWRNLFNLWIANWKKTFLFIP